MAETPEMMNGPKELVPRPAVIELGIMVGMNFTAATPASPPPSTIRDALEPSELPNSCGLRPRRRLARRGAITTTRVVELRRRELLRRRRFGALRLLVARRRRRGLDELRRRLVTRATRRRVFFILRLRLGFAIVVALLLGLLRCIGLRCSTSGLVLRLTRRGELRFEDFMVRLRLRDALSAALCRFVPKCAICLGVNLRLRFFPALRRLPCRGLLANRVVLTTRIQDLR